MIQYRLLLGGTRKPHITKDEFVITPKEKSKHVLVAHRNQVICYAVIAGFVLDFFAGILSVLISPPQGK
jgi:hypothetical protein